MNSEKEEEASDQEDKVENVGKKDKKDKKVKGIGNGRWLMIYPDNKYKSVWDMVIALILIISCILSPLFIAFDDG